MSGHKGLYEKYEVRRKATGEVVDGFFLLRPKTDTAAWLATMFYSYLTHNPVLGEDVRNWLREMKLMQEFTRDGGQRGDGGNE